MEKGFQRCSVRHRRLTHVCALQVLKSKDRPLVSSVFFMCLPDKVCIFCSSPCHRRPSLFSLYHALCIWCTSPPGVPPPPLPPTPTQSPTLSHFSLNEHFLTPSSRPADSCTNLFLCRHSICTPTSSTYHPVPCNSERCALP